MAQTRKGANTGSDMELALPLKESTQGEEEEIKYQPAPPTPPGSPNGKESKDPPLQKDESESGSEKDSHQGSKRKYRMKKKKEGDNSREVAA